MSNKFRKADCHTRRVNRHEAKRQAKAKQARAYRQTPTKRSPDPTTMFFKPASTKGFSFETYLAKRERSGRIGVIVSRARVYTPNGAAALDKVLNVGKPYKQHSVLPVRAKRGCRVIAMNGRFIEYRSAAA